MMTPTIFAMGILLLLSASADAFSAKPAGSSNSQRVFVSTPSKVNKRLVRDCMTPRDHMVVLKPTTSTDEAISTFLAMGISGAPVLESGKVLGVVSSSDFMFKDFSGALIDIEGSPESVESVVEIARKITGTTVKELMSPHVTTINQNEPMAVAADKMARGNLHRLLVTSEVNGELVGILSRSDVMRDVLTTVRGILPETSSAGGQDGEPGKAMP